MNAREEMTQKITPMVLDAMVEVFRRIDAVNTVAPLWALTEAGLTTRVNGQTFIDTDKLAQLATLGAAVNAANRTVEHYQAALHAVSVAKGE